jgi:molybdopterin converting factor small subunit
MAVTLTIPTALRQYAGNQAKVEFDAHTVGELLSALSEQYPDIRGHLYNEQGKLRSFVNVYVGDEDIRYLDGEATELRDKDTVSIIPAIAGGNGRTQ